MRVRGIVALMLSVVALGCGGRDIAPYPTTITDLALPSTWQVVKTIVQTQGGQPSCVELIDGNCPAITKYYVVDGKLSSLLSDVQDAASRHGFADIRVNSPDCATATSSVAAACFMTASKGEMALEVTVYRPGQDVDGLGISVADLATVRLILHHN